MVQVVMTVEEAVSCFKGLSSFEMVEQSLDTSAMAEQFPRNSLSTDSGSAGDQTSSGCDVVHPRSRETSMWEEWTQATSTVGDEVSTSNFLPDLSTSSTSSSSRLAFQASDWMSSFHPLSHHPSLDITPDHVDHDHQPAFDMHDSLDSEKLHHEMIVGGIATDALDPLVCDSKTTGDSRQLLRALGPLSPSSPLAIHNGLLNPLNDPWDACPSASSASTLQWSTVTTTGHTYNGHLSDGISFLPDHSATAIDYLEGITTTTSSSFAPKLRHMEIFIGPNGTFESATPGSWTPQPLFDHHHGSSEMSKALTPTSVPPMKLMASLREAPMSCGQLYVESKLNPSQERGRWVSDPRDHRDRTNAAPTSPAVGVMLSDSSQRGADSTIMTSTQPVWPGKHRLELLELVDGTDQADLKRPKIPNSVEEAKATLQWSDQAMRTYCPAPNSGRCSLVSQAMEIIAIGPALNTNGKPRARRGSATDPQSVYARHRREKINERLKSLQNLVPNGGKVDVVTMLDEAIHYVKFLQHQFELLKSDDRWMYATPNTYNGVDLSELSTHSPELELSSA